MTESTATPEQIRSAAEEFALTLLNDVLEVIKETAEDGEDRVLAETTRRRATLVAGVIATYGEDDGRAILDEGLRIAEELHTIMKQHCEETRSATA